MTDFEVGDKVSFRLSDSINRTVATVESIETFGDGTLFDPSYTVYTVRDDRRGWQHRINDLTMDIHKVGEHTPDATPTTAASPF